MGWLADAWARLLNKAPGVTYLGELQKLQIEPGDILVLNSAKHLDDETANWMRALIEERFPLTQCLVISGGITLEVLRRAPPEILLQKDRRNDDGWCMPIDNLEAPAPHCRPSAAGLTMGTKNNPGKIDCLASADPDETMFYLLGRDRMGPSLVDLWALAREYTGENAAVVRDARDIASDMRNDLYLRRKRECKVLEVVPLPFLEEIVQRRRTEAVAAAAMAERAKEVIRLSQTGPEIQPLTHVNGSEVAPKDGSAA